MTETTARKPRQRKGPTTSDFIPVSNSKLATETAAGTDGTQKPASAQTDVADAPVDPTVSTQQSGAEPASKPSAHPVDPTPAGDPLARKLGETLGEQAVRRALDEHLAQVQPSPAPSAPLPRRSFINDMPDRGLFAAVTVFAGLTILLVKVAGAPATPVAVFAVGSMLAYGVAAYRLPSVRLRLDRLGDNFYYMGFVFTLASMAAALLQLNAGMEVEALLGSFGIALLTTMVGIAGRVTFVQMRSEVDDVEERIRRDLLEAGDLLRGQLAAAVRDLEAFRLGTQQMLQERMEQTLDKYTEAAVGQVTRLGNTAQEIMDRVDTAFGANHEHAQELNRIAQKTVEAADRLLTRIAAINPPPDVLERKLEGFTERLTASAQAFVEASAAEQDRQKALAGFGAQLEEILSRLSRQTSGLDAGIGSIAKVGTNVSTLLEDLSAKLGSLGAAVATQERELSSGVQGIARVREQLDADLSASRAAVLDVQRALAETARIVKAELQGTSVQ